MVLFGIVTASGLVGSSQTLLKNYQGGKILLKAPELTKKQQLVPPNFHTRHFGFFCKQELRLQQKGVPVLFRLGSVEQCNTLEGKPGYR